VFSRISEAESLFVCLSIFLESYGLCIGSTVRVDSFSKYNSNLSSRFRFANYTVQYVLEMGLGLRIVEQILGKIELLSKQKFSSNVVEKCIVAASPSLLEAIVGECEQIMGSLLHDAFANFVAQKLLEVTGDHQSRRYVGSFYLLS
jgi:hypothetical protein